MYITSSLALKLKQKGCSTMKIIFKLSLLISMIIILSNGKDSSKLHTHCLFLDLNCKRPGVSSDGNFRSCLIRRSGYGWLFPFPVGGNGNNLIYPLLSTVLSTWTEPETFLDKVTWWHFHRTSKEVIWPKKFWITCMG